VPEAEGAPYVVATRVVQRIEREFEVDTLRCGEMLVWPLIRLALWHQITRSDARIIADRALPPAPASPSPSEPAPLGAAAYAPWRVPAERADPADRCDAVFVTRERDHCELVDGAPWQRYVDPVLGLARRRWSCAKLHLTGSPPLPSLPHWDLTLPVDVAQFLTEKHAHEREAGIRGPRHIEGFEALRRYLRDVIVGLELPESWFLDRLREIDDYTALFTRLLSILRPRAAFVSCFYTEMQLALVRAARLLGVASVDLQHGAQGPWHQAYERWHRVPAGGYDTLPDLLWVWGPYARAQHERLFEGVPSAPRAIVGGYPWLNRWLEKDDPAPDPHTEALRRETARFRRVVLVTWSAAPEPPTPPLCEALRRAPRDWLWLLRMHPNGRHALPGFLHLLEESGRASFEIERASAAPLHPLLRLVTHHVTRSSTIGYEALRFGVPTAIVHPGGLERHADYVRRGVFAAPATGDELIRFLERDPAEGLPREPLPYFDVDASTPERALEEILERVPPADSSARSASITRS
jgi:hypothetical protein